MAFLADLRNWLKAHIHNECGRSPLFDTLESVRRQHAIVQAEMLGAQVHMGEISWFRGALFLRQSKKRLLRDLVEQTTSPCLLIDPRPGLRIVDANDACTRATLTDRGRVAGQKLFSAFPDNAENPDASGVSNLFESLCACSREGRSKIMNLQRYDMSDAEGQFVERYWHSVNMPVFDDDGKVIYLLNCPNPVDPL